MLNQFHRGQQRLAVADQKLGKLSLALPSLVNRMVVSFHGGSPFKVSSPRFYSESRGNRRLNFQLQTRHRPVVVARNTTDEQLRSLLWLFRERVQAGRFKELGLK